MIRFAALAALLAVAGCSGDSALRERVDRIEKKLADVESRAGQDRDMRMWAQSADKRMTGMWEAQYQQAKVISGNNAEIKSLKKQISDQQVFAEKNDPAECQ